VICAPLVGYHMLRVYCIRSRSSMLCLYVFIAGFNKHDTLFRLLLSWNLISAMSQSVARSCASGQTECTTQNTPEASQGRPTCFASCCLPRLFVSPFAANTKPRYHRIMSQSQSPVLMPATWLLSDLCHPTPPPSITAITHTMPASLVPKVGIKGRYHGLKA